MDERRTLRVSVAVQEELAEIIGFELDDPRLAEVAVSEAHVNPDSKHAHITVILGGRRRRWRPWIMPGIICVTSWLPG